MTPYRFRFSSGSIPFYPLRYFSHFLIAICIPISIIGWTFPIVIGYFGLHRLSLIIEVIPYFIGQITLFQFLHADPLHILMNGFFLYQAGPELESRMGKRKFIIFFLASTLFTALSLYIFAPGSLTIGISGFCMAILSYLWLEQSRIRHPMANQTLIMLIINIAVGLSPGISFVGHAAGALWGVISWKLRR